jgi:hypothetical protein
VAAWIYAADPKWWIAGLSGALMGAGWNYMVTSAFVWRQAPRMPRLGCGLPKREKDEYCSDRDLPHGGVKPSNDDRDSKWPETAVNDHA